MVADAPVSRVSSNGTSVAIRPMTRHAWVPLCIWSRVLETRTWPSIVSSRSKGQTPPKAGTGSFNQRDIHAIASKPCGFLDLSMMF